MQKLHLILMLSLISNSIYTTPIESEIEQTQNLIIDDAINKLLDQALAQLHHLERTLENLALQVYTADHKLPNKSQITTYITQTRQLINEIKSNSFLVPQLEIIATLHLINLELTQNLANAIKTNQWQAVTDLGELIKRHQDAEFNFNQLPALQQDHQATLVKLDAEVERFGLGRIQRQIHKMEDRYEKLTAFASKHKTAIQIAGYSAAAILYLNYQTDNWHLPNWLKPNWLEKLTDRLPHIPHHPLGKAPAYHNTNPDVPGNRPSISGLQLPISDKYTSGHSNLSNKPWGLGNLERNFSLNLGTDFSPSVLIPGAALGFAAHHFMEDPRQTNYMVIGGQVGLHLIPHPMVRMAALSYDAFQLHGSNKFSTGKVKFHNWLRKHYYKLRGEQNKNNIDKKPTVTFASLIDQTQAQEFEVIVDYIINPDKYERTKLTPAKGFLMVGPPRTGKSYLAQAICGEINARRKLLGKPETTNFIALDADLMHEKSFFTLMEFINSKAPCVVFIDEIDLLNLNRGDGDKENKLLSQLLTHMSGYIDPFGQSQNRQVIFIAATNNPYLLDDALVKPGRFGKVVSFEYPHLELRIRYLKRELANRCIIDLKPEFIAKIAQELEGYTFEDMQLVIQSALQIAHKSNKVVSESHFQAAVDSGVKAILPEASPLSDLEIDAIAAYQAGKALATKLLVPSRHISSITTMPVRTKIENRKDSKVINKPIVQFGNVFTYKNTDLLGLQSNQDLELHCQIMLAGHIAQELLMQQCFYNYRAEDQQLAYTLAQQIVLKGHDYSKLTEGLQQQVLEEAYRVKVEANQAVEKLLKDHLPELQKLHTTLKAKRHIREAELDALLK